MSSGWHWGQYSVVLNDKCWFNVAENTLDEGAVGNESKESSAKELQLG